MIYYKYPTYSSKLSTNYYKNFQTFPHYPQYSNKQFNKSFNNQSTEKPSQTQTQYKNNYTNLEKTKKISNKSEKVEETHLFEILGIKLYFDDILLICLIFFLYNEGVQDQYLFIVLILLLLS